MDLEEIGINAENWVDLTEDRGYWRVLVNAALNLQVSQLVTMLAQFQAPVKTRIIILKVMIQLSRF